MVQCERFSSLLLILAEDVAKKYIFVKGVLFCCCCLVLKILQLYAAAVSL